MVHTKVFGVTPLSSLLLGSADHLVVVADEGQETVLGGK